jgi:YggT family protein
MLITTIFQIIEFLLNILKWIVIIQAILSWLVAFNVINTYNDFVRQLLYALDRVLNPLLNPIRRILPDFGGLDFSPMVLILIIIVLQQILVPNIYKALVNGGAMAAGI